MIPFDQESTKEKLTSLLMQFMSTTERAEFLPLQPFRCFLFIFIGTVIPIFALCTFQNDLFAHLSTPFADY